MSNLVVFVLDNPDLCQDVLDAWDQMGVKGITILESTGIGRLRKAGMRDDMPLFPSLSDLFKGRECRHRTLFSVVETEEQALQLVKAAEAVVGELSQPDTGLLFIVPVSKVFGLKKNDR